MSSSADGVNRSSTGMCLWGVLGPKEATPNGQKYCPEFSSLDTGVHLPIPMSKIIQVS